MDGGSTVVPCACGVGIFFRLQKKIRERSAKRGHNVFVPGDGHPYSLFGLLRLRNCVNEEKHSLNDARHYAR